MGKKKKHTTTLMKKWPKKETEQIAPAVLLLPLKRILHEGYRLERRSSVVDFVYDGYNIGKDDLVYSPSPEERFSAKWLEMSTRFKHTLLDNVLFVAFQLGAEHGRRCSNKNKMPQEIMDNLLAARTNRIKLLKEKLSQYDKSYGKDETVPLISNNQDLMIESSEFNNVDA